MKTKKEKFKQINLKSSKDIKAGWHNDDLEGSLDGTRQCWGAPDRCVITI